MVPQSAAPLGAGHPTNVSGTLFAVRVPGHVSAGRSEPEVTKMEPDHSVGQTSSQDNAVEATSTPDDLPVRPGAGSPTTGSAPPVKPSDASENTQGNEVSNEDMEPSDASESNPDPADSQRTS